MKKLFNKRGSYIVFITIIFTGIILMVSAVIWASGEKAIGSTMDRFGRLWGRSILSEYDTYLKDRYGLFCYYGNEYLVSEKLNFYVDYSIKDKKYIDYSLNNVLLTDYAILDKKNFESQIDEINILGVKPKLIRECETFRKTSANRYIKNSWIIDTLPSHGEVKNLNISDLLGKVKKQNILSEIKKDTSLDLYIFRFFKDYVNERDLGETYFNNEVEYIISGKLDDEKSRKAIYNDLILIRNAMNLAYLYSSPTKKNQALMYAELITPGPEAYITQALILETWAYLEAKNDLELLYDDKPVKFSKTDSNWALSIQNALCSQFNRSELKKAGVRVKTSSKTSSKKYVSPQNIEGIDYDDYLKILLLYTPYNSKLSRTMDLIQINMKYLYCDFFALSDYYVGLKYSFEINGKEHEFEETY